MNSVPLEDGKLLEVCCPECGGLLFYYTYTVHYTLRPVHQHARDRNGKIFKERPNNDVFFCCGAYQNPISEECKLIDNPFK